MTFVHDDPEFGQLIRIVADRRRLSPGLVEKDYWVTHTLWSLMSVGLEIWFKGGTSLSKGFDIIHRFSEDIDVKVDPGSCGSVPSPSNWTSDGKAATAERMVYFEALNDVLRVPGARVERSQTDDAWRSAEYRVYYPGAYLDALDPAMSPFVVLEVGSARVTPSVDRNLTSFVHAHLDETGLTAQYNANTPLRIHCVHPFVTLLEKLDAIRRRFARPEVEPASFVRHYEDAARIIRAAHALPSLEGFASVADLSNTMLHERQLRGVASSTDAAFRPDGSDRWVAIANAYRAIDAMFWGDRLTLDQTCVTICEWITMRLGS